MADNLKDNMKRNEIKSFLTTASAERFLSYTGEQLPPMYTPGTRKPLASILSNPTS